MITVEYAHSTLTLTGDETVLRDLPKAQFDQRSATFRAPASSYRAILTRLHGLGAGAYKDLAKDYSNLSLRLRKPITPRIHQSQALKAWLDAGRSGVVQLPTGAGKTYLAVLAIVETARPTLIVVPTIDLLHQWAEVLGQFLDAPIGTLGGGSRDIQDITVSTYDSAVLNMEGLGNKFGMLVVDECHHLPAPQYQNIALGSIAPFRLGLSATVERADGKEAEIYQMLGPMVHEGHIKDMGEDVLAPYDVVSLEVPMTEEELTDYTAARKIYTDFLRTAGVNFSNPRGWSDFVIRAARLPGGKEAMQAYRLQKSLAQGSSAKLDALWSILLENSEARIIVFTEDNQMAYRIGRRFVVPVLTHQTKLKERKKILQSFRDGEIKVIVTSKVLNEGVDVPEAAIGVVVSGSGGVREHVQRLGRILRHRPGKRATLYEIVSKNTSEYFVNQRRRQHHAYQGSAEI